MSCGALTLEGSSPILVIGSESVGRVITKHFYANGLQVANMVGSTLYYFHQDALGSTRLVSTATVGNAVQHQLLALGASAWLHWG